MRRHVMSCKALRGQDGRYGYAEVHRADSNELTEWNEVLVAAVYP